MKLLFMPGDGIGPEVGKEAKKILDRVATQFDHKFEYTQALIGGASIDVHSEPLTKEALRQAKESDAILLGAVGGDQRKTWYSLPPQLRPEAGLLKLRKELNLFCNLRPAFLFPVLKKACPLKEEFIPQGFDFVVVRELTGGVYFGEHKLEEKNGIRCAVDYMSYDEEEIKRIAKKAFELAGQRKGKLCSVDKANVLATSRLWRDVVTEVSSAYPKIELNHMFVDNCAMQLVKDPTQFDVILTENMFGDILSDEASMITGSIGMLPSASLSDHTPSLYEPSHGSAPDIAGLDKANPIAAILSVAMMLRYSFSLFKEAAAIEAAVAKTLEEGYYTEDLFMEKGKKVGTIEMGSLIAERI